MLTPIIPARMRRLPIDHRGFPVPWFAAVIDGVPDFRAADGAKFTLALRQKRCWVCGERLGVHNAFVIGPMCVVNRVTAEPPCHLECAEFSARACPFLSKPRMRRNDKNLPEGTQELPGIPIMRNPGAAAVYVTRNFRLMTIPGKQGSNPGTLIRLGEPEEVRWFAEGLPATGEQVLQAIRFGLPALEKIAKEESPEAVVELGRLLDRAMTWVPKEHV